jgi:alpha-amylase
MVSQDTTQLNPRFGDKADLLALSAELHKRGMFLMVDIVVNHVVANPAPTVQEMIDLNPDLLWRKVEQYHPRCPMDYGNTTSVEVCWMGDDKLPLADVNTENVEVIQALQTWIHDFVAEFGVDGLRIDGKSPHPGRTEVRSADIMVATLAAAKHVRPEYWQPFCASAGVFCIGEVYGSDIA